MKPMVRPRELGAFLFIFIILFWGIFSPAGAGLLKRPLSFTNITPKDGLSSEMVFAVAVQGDKVWFGTYGGGATLYDRSKKTFQAYTTKGEPTQQDDGVSIKWKNHLAYNHVSVIVPDKDRFWFGTYFYGFGGGGISYYRPLRKNPWKTFNTNKGRAKKAVSMAVDGDQIWVGSEKGLSLLDKKTGQWKNFFSVQDGLAGNFINALLVQPDSLWVGTNFGISRLSNNRQTWKRYGLSERILDSEIKSLARVEDRIWAGTSRGSLFEYDPSSDRWKKIDPADPLKDGGIHSIGVIRGKVFICRDNGVSVYMISQNQWDSITTADGLLSNTVFCATEDRDGVWFGTDQGASRLNGPQ